MITCASVYLNVGTPSGPDHIKLIVLVCPRMGQQSCCHTLDCFHPPSMMSCNIIHRRLVYIILHKPLQEEIQEHDIRQWSNFLATKLPLTMPLDFFL